MLEKAGKDFRMVHYCSGKIHNSDNEVVGNDQDKIGKSNPNIKLENKDFIFVIKSKRTNCKRKINQINTKQYTVKSYRKKCNNF